MLAGFKRYIALIGLVLILFLSGNMYYQRTQLQKLRTENKAQQAIIAEQQKLNQTLQQNLDKERQAVEVQQKVINQLKTESEVKREKVKVILQKEPCAARRLPRGVVSQLQ